VETKSTERRKDETMTTTTTTIIKKREYEVKTMNTNESARADLIRRGWDGQMYMLYGKRGARHLAYRNAKTGEFDIVW
jgi:hypothetical protein